MAWVQAELEEKQEYNNDKKNETFLFEEGEPVEFEILKMGSKTDDYGKVKPWYLVEDGDNNKWFLPGHTQLVSKLKQLKVQPGRVNDEGDEVDGDLIMVELTGEKDINRDYPMKLYKVQKWEEEEGDRKSVV